MRALNVFLSLVVSLAIAAAIGEIGLRLIGLGPQPTIHRFDPDLGWSKTPGATSERKTREFDVHTTINSLGLRDDEMKTPQKPAGVYRVLILGDSFVLGYTVERENLFVDILESWWKAEGRNVDVINAGTEGYSTDQEVLWYQKHGRDFTPDLVVLCPYENDLYWNGQTSYERYPKPRFTPGGEPEARKLTDPGPLPVRDRWALTRLIGLFARRQQTWSPDGKNKLLMEWAAYFHEAPDFMVDAYARTRGALSSLKNSVEGTGSRLVVAPIPGKACIHAGAREALETQVGKRDWLSCLKRWIHGEAEPASLANDHWSPDEPVDRVLGMCRELSILSVDARELLRSRADRGIELYFESDWHLDRDGNRAFARYLHAELDKAGLFPPAFAARNAIDMPVPAEKREVPTWIVAFASVWLAASVLYKITYKQEPLWRGVLVCGGMLALVFGIAVGGNALLSILPLAVARAIAVIFVLGLLGFILYKLGRRIGTIVELLWSFTRRGHWYLMPLIVVLLTVGSLLVVAASSPLVAPFIYTLF